jgi:hypothetical protein
MATRLNNFLFLLFTENFFLQHDDETPEHQNGGGNPDSEPDFEPDSEPESKPDSKPG